MARGRMRGMAAGRRAVAAGLALVLAGCAGTAPPGRAACEAPAAAMAPCADVVPLRPGLTYREVLDAHAQDRQRLQRCAAQHEELRRTLAACLLHTEARRLAPASR